MFRAAHTIKGGAGVIECGFLVAFTHVVESALDKLRKVRAMIDAGGRPVRLEIDGGVKPDNIGEIASAGADSFVAGSAIFGKPDYEAVVAQMKAAVAAAR